MVRRGRLRWFGHLERKNESGCLPAETWMHDDDDDDDVIYKKKHIVVTFYTVIQFNIYWVIIIQY